MKNANKSNQSKFLYGIFKLLCISVSGIVFRRKFIRNEIKDKKGPLVIISNHAAALDFVNLVGATKRPMNFVISNSFYRTLPFKAILPKLGLIPKQQFQTSPHDLKRMKEIIDSGEILVIYPAGLMSDDGTQTPLPAGTYKFLQWLKADIYMAKNFGTYFVMPKWRVGGMRSGKTFLDIYKLYDKDEIASADIFDIQTKVDNALSFDAYAEQEELLVKHKKGNDIRGIENVLYKCPNCKTEFSVRVKNKNTIYCTACDFQHVADEYQFLHNVGGADNELRHISDWNVSIREDVKREIESGKLTKISSAVKIHMISPKSGKFESAGEATVSLDENGFKLVGNINDEPIDITVSADTFPALPYKPGVYFEIQHGEKIYRCFPEDGRLTIKFINMIEELYRIKAELREASHCNT